MLTAHALLHKYKQISSKCFGDPNAPGNINLAVAVMSLIASFCAVLFPTRCLR